MEDVDINKVAAIKFRYNKKMWAYNFVMEPELLLKSCFVLRREITGKKGYQRLLDEGRINEIREFIEKNKETFPNNIIINYPKGEIGIDELSCEKTKNKDVLDCIIKLPDEYCSA